MFRQARILVATVAVLAGGLASPAAQAALVTITSGDVVAQARTGDRGAITQHYTDTALPASQTLLATAGSATMRNDIAYTDASGQVVLAYTLAGSREGSEGSFLHAYGGTYFTVAQDTPYALAGWFDAIEASGLGDAFFGVELWDQDPSAPLELFRNDQWSKNTTQALFRLGATDGTYRNILRGAMSGQLLAGHTYWFNFNVTNGPEAFGTDGGSSVGGAFSLSLGEAANAVPEPASLALVLIAALVGFVVSRTTRDRRK